MVWERGHIVPKKNEKESVRLELTEAERQDFKTYEMRDSDDEDRSSDESELRGMNGLHLTRALTKRTIANRKSRQSLNFTQFVRNKGLMWDMKQKYFNVSQNDLESAFNKDKLKAEYMRKKHQKKKFDRITFAEFAQMHIDRV
jgi:hypothetical protein